MLHFIGHGDYDVDTDQGVIALVGEDGRRNLVEAEQLADLLNEARPTPRLVVLNSCSSGEQGTQDLFSGTAAALVRSGISAVAAMQFTVSDPAAIDFAAGFYTAIAHGRSVDDAVRSGRISILGRPHTLEWVTPVLYVRGESTQLFGLAPPERKGRRQEKPPAQGAPKPAAGQPGQTPPPGARPTIAAAQLRAMFVEARAEVRAEHYAAAIGLLDDLLSLDPDYRDATALRDIAVRRRDLADKYQQAIDAQAANDWSTAARLYEQVLELQPDYRDAAIRREQCEKAQRIIDLQDELRIHAESKNWQSVIEVNDELAALDPEAADPDGLATSARDTLRAAVERERIYTRARAAEDAGDWTTAISHYSSLKGYRDAETRLRTCQQRQQEAEVAKRRQAKIRFRQSSLGIPATLIAVAALTGAVPPIYLLITWYPVDTNPGDLWDLWDFQRASRIFIGISFCFLAWMAKSLGDRRAVLSAALMVPVIVLHMVVDPPHVWAWHDLPADVEDFLRKVAYPTVLALAAMVGILFGVAVITKCRVTWARVLIAWGVCGVLEAILSCLAKIVPWPPGKPPPKVFWGVADSVLVVQNLLLLAVAVFMFMDSRRAKNEPGSASV